MEDRSRLSRYNRRRFLRAAALGGAGLAGASLVACGGNQTATSSSSATQVAQPKRGGTVSRSRGEQVDAYSSGFDPQPLTGAYGPLMGLFYQNLIRYHNVTLELSPELAQSWEQPSQTEYIFTLAPGVKWHNKPPANGRALTAADAVFSLNRFRSDDPKFINRSLLGSVDRIETVDNSRFRIVTKAPDVTLIRNLSDVTMAIMNPEVVEKAGRFATADTAVGTGAYILESSDDAGSVLVRNPEFWKSGMPYLDSVRLVALNDPQSRWSAFLSGQFDVTIAPGQEAKKFVAEQGSKYFTDWAKEVATWTIWPNTRKKPFDDKRVTRALRLLVDHSEAVTGWAEVWYGRGTLQGSGHFPLVLDSWDFTEDEYRQARTPLFLEWKQPKDDAAREANSMLSAAGFTRDNPLRFELSNTSSPVIESSTQLLQRQYQRLSQSAVQPELKFFENTNHVGLMSRGEFDVSGPVARGGYLEPDAVLQLVYKTTGGQNFGKYSDPALDEMIDRQRTIFDAAQRQTLVREILTNLMQNAPYTGFTGVGYLNVAQPKLKDFTPEHVSRFRGDQYERIWLDA